MTDTTMRHGKTHRATLLTLGFRPFFLGASLWAAIAMILWLPMLAGRLDLPTAFDPVSWHAHEFLFGYLGAVLAGFLLTAVPNWTGRPPLVGGALGTLAGLWLAGRVAVALSAMLPALAVAAIDLGFPVALGALVLREILAGRNWRNLIVVGMLAAFALGNAVFHWEATAGQYAAGGIGLRLGLGAGILMIAVIGGRIVPAFTRNWLVLRGKGALPAPPMQRFDKLALLVLLAGVLGWVAVPDSLAAAGLLAGAGVLHLLRLARWCGHRTLAEPLVTVLHAGYLFLPLGALAIAAGIAWPEALPAAAAQHLWMGGAIGLMTLAVMTRATLGHTGQDLSAGAGTVAVYAALVAAVLARFGAGLLPASSAGLHLLSGLCWIAAHGGFALLYGPLLVRARPTAKA